MCIFYILIKYSNFMWWRDFINPFVIKVYQKYCEIKLFLIYVNKDLFKSSIDSKNGNKVIISKNQ